MGCPNPGGMSKIGTCKPLLLFLSSHVSCGSAINGPVPATFEFCNGIEGLGCVSQCLGIFHHLMKDKNLKALRISLNICLLSNSLTCWLLWDVNTHDVQCYHKPKATEPSDHRLKSLTLGPK